MYAAASYAAEVELFSFRSYVADSLRAAPQGRYMQARWADIAHPQNPLPERDPNEVVQEVVSGAGLVVIEDEPS